MLSQPVGKRRGGTYRCVRSVQDSDRNGNGELFPACAASLCVEARSTNPTHQLSKLRVYLLIGHYSPACVRSRAHEHELTEQQKRISASRDFTARFTAWLQQICQIGVNNNSQPTPTAWRMITEFTELWYICWFKRCYWAPNLHRKKPNNCNLREYLI